MYGKSLRLKRIFKPDGYSVVIALDHGQFQGPIPGLVDIRDTIQKVVMGKPDALILNPGVLSKYHECVPGDVGIILRLTGASTSYSPKFDFHRLTTSVDHALRLGADAVIVMCFVAGDGEIPSLEIVAKVAEQCDKEGVPLFVEVLSQNSKDDDIACIATGIRAAFELGADVLKVYYTGRDTFSTITSAVPIPILIAGGPKNLDAFSMVREAINQGAKGVAFGRNVFQADNVTEYVQKLVSCVHHHAK